MTRLLLHKTIFWKHGIILLILLNKPYFGIPREIYIKYRFITYVYLFRANIFHFKIFANIANSSFLTKWSQLKKIAAYEEKSKKCTFLRNWMYGEFG